MKETVAWLVVGLVLANAVLANISPAKLRHLAKKTYCEKMQGQQIYYREQLDTDCAEKVQIFGDYVSKNNFEAFLFQLEDSRFDSKHALQRMY